MSSGDLYDLGGGDRWWYETGVFSPTNILYKLMSSVQQMRKDRLTLREACLLEYISTYLHQCQMRLNLSQQKYNFLDLCKTSATLCSVHLLLSVRVTWGKDWLCFVSRKCKLWSAMLTNENAFKKDKIWTFIVKIPTVASISLVLFSYLLCNCVSW